VLDVELEHAPERLERLFVALVVEQRAPQQQQRVEIVGILLQHVRQPHDGGADTAGAS
jgi:hypothetical protein